MASKVYPKAKEAFLAGDIDLAADTIRAVLIDTGAYTYSDAHDFYNDLGGVVGAESGALASKTVTDGVFDAADVTFSAVTGNTVEAVVLFQDTGNAAADRLIVYLDGRAQVEVAVDASSGATSVTVEELPGAIASGVVMTLISGTGPATMTTSGSAGAGARAVSVSAIGSGVTAGAVYEYAVTGSGLPVTPNGGDITVQWDNGANKIFRL